MITREEMFEQLLKACPSFELLWAEFCEDWRSQREPPLYIALGDAAQHLVRLLAKDETAEFPAVFEVVERWHIEGEPWVREAATVGLLESLDSAAQASGIDPAVFEPWLLPESKSWWDKLKRFWAGDSSALRKDEPPRC